MKDEVPPEYLWEDGRGLELWWATVTDKREQGMSGMSTPKSGRDDSGPGMAENDFARALKSSS